MTNKHFMKHKLITLIFIFFSILLVACENNPATDSNSVSKETSKETIVTIGQYLKQHKPILIYDLNNSGVNKDTLVTHIYIVDEGKVATYDISLANKTLGNLSEMSEKEIISLAKENHKNLMEKQFNDMLVNSKETLERYTSELAEYESKIARGEHAFLNGSIDYPKAIEYLSYLVSELEKQSDLSDYYEPKSYKLSINLETDGTGNNTMYENLKFQRTSFDSEPEIADSLSLINNILPLEDYGIRISSFYPSTIYNKTYSVLYTENGGAFAIAVENEKQALWFDQPDTKIKGITIDGE